MDKGVMSVWRAHELTYKARLHRVSDDTWLRISAAINEATWEGRYECDVKVDGNHAVIVEYLERELGYEVLLVPPEDKPGWVISIGWGEPPRVVECHDELDGEEIDE